MSYESFSIFADSTTHALATNPVIGHLGWHGAPWVRSQE
jgi:hypothetical protein